MFTEELVELAEILNPELRILWLGVNCLIAVGIVNLRHRHCKLSIRISSELSWCETALIWHHGVYVAHGSCDTLHLLL